MDKILQLTDSLRSNIRIVLVHPSHMGNIGACARAMWVMGLDQLVLVGAEPLTEVAFQRAAGAREVLEKCRWCSSLPEAIADCRWVVASSARHRSVSWPMSSVRGAAKHLLSEAKTAPVAAIFGSEQSGLSSKDLQLANEQMVIDASSIYGSLNLAMAVQILTYELFQEFKRLVEAEHDGFEHSCSQEKALLASQGSLSYAQTILKHLALKCEFLHAQELSRVLGQLNAMLLRARPTQREINIYIGLLRQIDEKIGSDTGLPRI